MVGVAGEVDVVEYNGVIWGEQIVELGFDLVFVGALFEWVGRGLVVDLCEDLGGGFVSAAVDVGVWLVGVAGCFLCGVGFALAAVAVDVEVSGFEDCFGDCSSFVGSFDGAVAGGGHGVCWVCGF